MLLRSMILAILVTGLASAPRERRLSLRMFSKQPGRPARKLNHSKIKKELKRAEIRVEKKDVTMELKEEKKATSDLKKQIEGLERTLKEMKSDISHNENKLQKMKKISQQNKAELKRRLKGNRADPRR